MVFVKLFYPEAEAKSVVSDFAYMTICMEGKDILKCLDGYINKQGNGLNDDMGCYFACELDPKDPDRIDDSVLVYSENNITVKKVYLSEVEFFYEFLKAFERAAFLFDDNMWGLIQKKLSQLKMVLCPN